MADNGCYCAPVMPELEMYAGETIPWNVQILDDHGEAYLHQDLSAYSASLALMPYKVSHGLGMNALAVAPVLEKPGVMETKADGSLYAVFEMTKQDTIMLSGKFTYQITVVFRGDRRVSQGHVLIRQNIHHAF